LMPIGIGKYDDVCSANNAGDRALVSHRYAERSLTRFYP
jgi:hypothetical protein